MISSDLFKKYNVPGPRYTSYPTVPYWSDNPTSEEWISSVVQSLSDASSKNIGAALYIHIPFCESLCTYCGCNTRITRNHKVGLPYIESVLKEWQIYAARVDRKISISEIHLGGGTPTFLSPEELKRLVSSLLNGIRVTPDFEFSIEADPRVTNAEHIKTLSELGFKRLSLGIQDFDPRVQEAVHRIQSVEQVRKVTESAREVGFSSINYDLIYGLPFQNRESVIKTIETVRGLRPDRIAFYGYAHVPWIKPGQRRFTEADLPASDEKRALYEIGRRLFEEVGYREIGMDHFALESDSLWQATLKGTLHRNFMGYTSRNVSPLIGLGVSAIGDSWRAFAQNEKLVENYQSRVEKGELPIARGHVLNPEDQILRRHVLNLMTRFETSWREIEAYVPYLESIQEKISELVNDGLVILDDRKIKVTPEGRPFLRNICMAFDARLARQAPATQLFSKTI